MTHPLGSPSLYNPSPECGRPVDLFLANRIEQGWQDVIFVIMLHRTAKPLLLGDSLSS